MTNAGLIRGIGGFAVRFIGAFDDTLANQAGGMLRGGGSGAAIQTGAGDDTVTSAGAITHDGGSGAVAIALEAGNDTLSFQSSAPTVTGGLDGGAGSDTLKFELSSGGAMTVAGAISNFETLRVVSGTTTLSGVTITGGTNSVLTVEGGAGLNLTGAFIGDAAITVQSGGVLTLDSGATYSVDLNGLVANALAGYDQVIGASGSTIHLGGAGLALNLGFTPTVGDVFTLFDVVSGATIDGAFSGLAEGASLTAGGATFALSYVGGEGRDVTLTALSVSAIPEPGSAVVWCGLGVLIVASGRRRSRRLPDASAAV